MSSKKSKRLILSISIFIILAAIVVLQVTVLNKRNQSNFKEIINPVDYTTIDRIEYVMPNANVPVIIVKDNGWKISRNDSTFTADAMHIENTLRETTKIKPARIVAVSADKLEESGFTDDATIAVKYLSNNKVVAEFLIGGYEFKEIPNAQPNGNPDYRMFTFIKEPKNDIVYSIMGFLRTFFNNDISLLRNKSIFSINHDDILEVVGIFDDNSNNFSLTRNSDNLWMYNGIVVGDESIKNVDNFLQRLRSQTGIAFYYEKYNKDICETITVKGNNFSPITLNFYPIEGTEDYVYECNLYTEGVFYDKNGAQRGRLMLKL